MARQPRLSLPGVMHYVLQRGHNGGAIVHDAHDTEQLLQMLREAALSHRVVLHAYAVAANELRVLATPETTDGISRMMQAVGRRHAAAFNRRHGRSGALWDGRFRSALIEAGAPALLALRHVDAHGSAETALPDPHAAAPAPGAASVPSAEPVERSSQAHRTGGRRDAALVDPPAYWQLGNTPFERESRYRRLLAEPLTAAARADLHRALRGGWAIGSPAFLAGLAAASHRPPTPRPRGRPRRAA
jgi:putative transposase